MGRKKKILPLDYRCPECDRHVTEVVKGLCRKCYDAQYILTNKEKIAEYQKIYRRRRIKEDPEYAERIKEYNKIYQRDLQRKKARIFKLWKQGRLIEKSQNE